MAKIYDVEDKQARFALAYGRHPVRGTLTRHKTLAVGSDLQVTFQRALGIGEWEECEKLWYIQNEAATEIAGGNFNFHPGISGDAADSFFPDDIAHPNIAYDAIQLPVGLSADNKPENTIGIYKTLKTIRYSIMDIKIETIYKKLAVKYNLTVDTLEGLISKDFTIFLSTIIFFCLRAVILLANEASDIFNLVLSFCLLS